MPSYIDSVLQQFEQAQQRANLANISRYNQIMGGYGQLIGQLQQMAGGVPEAYRDIASGYAARTGALSNLLQGFGDVQREELAGQRERNLAAMQQDTLNRGLTATTIQDAARRGVESDYQKASRQLEDTLTRQQMDYMSRLTGEELGAAQLEPASRLELGRTMFEAGQQPLGVAERRTDTGPSLSDIAQLASLSGQAAASGGGGIRPTNPYSAAAYGGQTAGSRMGSNPFAFRIRFGANYGI